MRLTVGMVLSSFKNDTPPSIAILVGAGCMAVTLIAHINSVHLQGAIPRKGGQDENVENCL